MRRGRLRPPKPGTKRYIVGQKFGRLTVIEYAGAKTNTSLWRCKCDCGTIKNIGAVELRGGTTKSCGCLRLELLRRGGRIKENPSEMRSGTKESRWRKAVIERDNHTCRGCGMSEEANRKRFRTGLHAHHIKDWVLYPELRFEVSNGLTLCVSCHMKETGKRVAKLTKRKPMNILVDTEGKVTFIYHDFLKVLMQQGKSTTKRISNIEPNENGDWVAHIIGGPSLGPFRFREEALDAEIRYLEKSLFGEEPS